MNVLHKAFIGLQDLYVKLNSVIKPEMLHNFEKHDVLKKFLFYKEIEGTEGDYLEFGVYEGTSMKGAVSYNRVIGKRPMRFYGFDSFLGMKPEKGDEHAFYTSFDFSTDFKAIKKRFANFPEVKLIPGFFDKTLAKGPSEYGIKKAAIVMMDCDLYSSAKYAFKFLEKITQNGTIFILDDYFNYGADEKKGVKAAFDEFTKKNKLKVVEISRYGIGGIVFVVSGKSKN